jgi:HSP20 family protein
MTDKLAKAENIADQNSSTQYEEQAFRTPPVDIYQSENGFVLAADMPGVKQDSLSIDIENSVLTIEGRPQSTVFKGDQVLEEFELLTYKRVFELGSDIDQAKIEAELKDGVLHLRLPRSEAAQPRKIPVNA